jgi:hypothetical protein
MAYRYADYPARSNSLTDAGQTLLDSLEDEDIDRSVAIQDLESAAHVSPASEVMLRFAPEVTDRIPQPPEQTGTDDALSGILLELQSANVLMSAGVALNEHGRGPAPSLLTESLQQVEASRSAVTQELQARSQLQFAPAKGAKSPNLEKAKHTFRENAEGVLKDIVDDAASVISTVLEQTKKLDATKVLQSIDKLGESFEGIAAAGRLIRQGIEKLKSALESLTNLFGKDLLGRMKEKVRDLVHKFQSGQYTRDLLTSLFGVENTKGRIAEVLELSTIGLERFDEASNELPRLSDKYKSTMKLLQSLISGVVLAGSIISFLHLAAPWVPLSLAVTYVGLIAATVLIGMDYSDSGGLLHWVRGVGEIANGIRTTAG